MAGPTVFYAWQSDLPNNVAKKFIRDAATDALKRLAKEMVLEESPRLDHDTKDVSGLPSITDSITRKIDHCAIFLADVSLVSELIDKNAQPKLSPNSNVMIELGYAWARIGWERLVLVMNLKNGTQEHLPFDLKNRRFPYGYEIADDLSDLEQKSKELSSHLKMAFRGALQQEHQRVTDIVRKLDGYAIHFLRQNTHHTHFWEKDATENSIMGVHDRTLIRLLELEITELVQFSEAPTGYAYTWTYMGLLVLRLLNFGIPLVPPTQVHTAPLLDFEVNMNWLDELQKQRQSE